MAALYPTAIKTFTNKTDFTDIILALHVNDLQDEVNAIETNLGTNVKTGSGWIGSFDQITSNWTNLKDRLANIEYGLNIAYTAKLPSGGSTGQILSKSSGTNYDVAWSSIKEETVNPLLLLG